MFLCSVSMYFEWEIMKFAAAPWLGFVWMVFDTWEVLAKFLCVSFIHKGTIVHWWETPTISWKLLPFRVCCSLKQCFQHSKAFSNRACLKMAYIISIYIYLSLSSCLPLLNHHFSLCLIKTAVVVPCQDTPYQDMLIWRENLPGAEIRRRCTLYFFQRTGSHGPQILRWFTD